MRTSAAAIGCRPSLQAVQGLESVALGRRQQGKKALPPAGKISSAWISGGENRCGQARQQSGAGSACKPFKDLNQWPLDGVNRGRKPGRPQERFPPLESVAEEIGAEKRGSDWMQTQFAQFAKGFSEG